DLYRGDLLEGFFISDAPAFDEWLESARSDLRRRAVQAARTLTRQWEARGDPSAAIPWARRAVRLTPGGEETVRSLISLLYRTGDRTGAVAAFRELERRLEAGYEMRPSPETAALMHSVVSRPTGDAAAPAQEASAPHDVMPTSESKEFA